MKIMVAIEFDLATCFTDRGYFPPYWKTWGLDDIRICALFDERGEVREEAIEPLSELIKTKNWSWTCDAVAIWHASGLYGDHYQMFYKSR